MPRRSAPFRRRLGLETLEAREVPAVTLGSISQPQIPNDVPVFVPVNVTSTPAGAVTTTATTDNSNVTATLLTGGRSVRFDVSGVDSTGAAFSGSVTIRLFENVAPLLTQRVIDLVNSGFYNGKIFHRVDDLFSGATQENVIIQGGSPTGTGSGGSNLPDLPDEFNPDVRFVSSGLVAAANAGDDNNNSQFFFTDVGRPLSDQIQFLDFNHTIFGIVTDGFDTLQKMRNTPRSGSTPTTPLTINSAAVFTDTKNAVVKLTPAAGFLGNANVTVTANDGTSPTSQTFAVQSVVDPGLSSITKAFITTPIPDQTTPAGTAVTFTVPVTDVVGGGTTIAVRAAGTGFAGSPSNVTVSINQSTRQVTLTPTAGFTGTIQFKVGVRQTSQPDAADNYDTQTVTLTVTAKSTTTTPTDPTAGSFTATGSAPGTASTVTVRNADGSVRFTVPVFGDFTGGVKVASGDVTGDGVADVVVVPGFGGRGVVDVLDSKTGAITRTVTVFESTFRGGLFLQLGDAQSLGYDQVLVGAGNSGGPRVTLLDVKNSKELLNFFAADAKLRGGVDVDLGDVFSGKGQMIVTSLGPGAGPVVSLFSATTAASVGSFFAGDGTNQTGIEVKVGERANSTAARPIVVTPYGAPDGTTGTTYDPSKYINPDAKTTTTTTTTTGANTINVNSLLDGGS